MSVVQPPIDELLGQVDSRFTLSMLAAKRARYITDMISGTINPKALEDIKLASVTRLTQAKPLSLAMEEIFQGDVTSVSATDGAPAEAEVAPVVDATEFDELVEADALVEDTAETEL